MANKKDNIIEDEVEDEIPIEEPVSKGKKILFILVPLIIIGGAVIYAVMHFINKPSSKATTNTDRKEQVVQGEFFYVNINDILITLASPEGKRNFLKISLTLQTKDKFASEQVNAKLPIISDSFQVFLRELRPADLSGSAGLIMLKTELLKRVNKIVAPNEVMDVLFKEILLS